MVVRSVCNGCVRMNLLGSHLAQPWSSGFLGLWTQVVRLLNGMKKFGVIDILDELVGSQNLDYWQPGISVRVWKLLYQLTCLLLWVEVVSVMLSLTMSFQIAKSSIMQYSPCQFGLQLYEPWEPTSIFLRLNPSWMSLLCSPSWIQLNFACDISRMKEPSPY